MRPGRHAAEDGSFRRSAGVAMGRAVVLLLVAVVIGVLLLNGIDDEGDTTVIGTTDTTESRNTSTTAPPNTTTTAVRAARNPAEVKVLAVNGTTKSGIGAQTKDVLLAAKYNTLAPTDAAAKIKPVKATAIYFQPGYEIDAAAVARVLQLPENIAKALPPDAAGMLKESRNLPNANIVVMAGEDIIAKLPASTTSTTARSTSTTARATSTTARPTSSTTASTTSTTAKP